MLGETQLSFQWAFDFIFFSLTYSTNIYKDCDQKLALKQSETPTSDGLSSATAGRLCNCLLVALVIKSWASEYFEAATCLEYVNLIDDFYKSELLFD